MNYLITGGNGFIGSNLTQSLQEAGHTVISVDLCTPQFSTPDVFIPKDICENGVLEKILNMHDIHVIIHLAAISTIQEGMSDSAKTLRTNIDGTRNLLYALDATKKDIILIHASTDKVYGITKKGELYKEEFPISPLTDSPYDCSKAEADRMVMKWDARAQKHSAIVLRFCNIYGPCDLHTSRIIPGNLMAILTGKDIILNKYVDSVGQVHNFYRDMLYVEDLCNVILTIANRIDSHTHIPLLGHAFNLGTSECLSMETVLETMCKVLNTSNKPKINYIKTNEIPMQSMDFSKAQKAFNFFPKFSFEEGLKKTATWWIDYLNRKETSHEHSLKTWHP